MSAQINSHFMSTARGADGAANLWPFAVHGVWLGALAAKLAELLRLIRHSAKNKDVNSARRE